MVQNILFVHNEQRIMKYGAHYINELIVQKLKTRGYNVDCIYPTESLSFPTKILSGISNILFFYSLIEKRKIVAKYDLIQGTTYTPLAFLGCSVPIISHFGSTVYGFLKNVPSLKRLEHEHSELAHIFRMFRTYSIIDGIKSLTKPLRDIARIEIAVAKKSDAVIATSDQVKRELVRSNVPLHKIFVVHNAIEDYWFKPHVKSSVKAKAHILYLGRAGDDSFTIRLKGINRLIFVLKKFPHVRKTIIAMCHNTKAYARLFSTIPNTTAYFSLEKKQIPSVLSKYYGDIFIYTGRYEGFCLSLVEAMSQGLIPVTFKVGVASEIIDNGDNGYLIDSLEEMIEKINLLKDDRRRRERMAKRAVQTSKLFKSDILIRKYEEVYKRVSES